MTWFLSALVGFVTGILSGMGIGGGTLLVLWLTLAAGVPQREAQGINLLYFLPTAATALPAHIKNGYVEKKALLPAIGAGLVLAALGAWAASAMEVGLLKKLFGLFLLAVGGEQLLGKSRGE